MKRVMMIVAVLLAVSGIAEASTRVRMRPAASPRMVLGMGWYGLPVMVMGGRVPAPGLAQVDLNVRPKHARVLLDGRLIGPAGEFDGFPDYLYLQPGTYTLEAELGGYRRETATLEVVAGAGYDVKMRLEREPGVEKERWWDAAESGPVQRVYAPLQVSAAAGADPSLRPDMGRPRAPAGADPSLRPELGRPRGTAGADPPPRPDLTGARALPPSEPAEAAEGRTGQLWLRVGPETAAVYLDGAFLATARELGRLEQALAVGVGRHRIEVMAPGYEAAEREVMVEDDRETVVDIELRAGG